MILSNTKDLIFRRLKCTRCNYQWYPKIVDGRLQEPKTCANVKCRSKYWNRKKVRYW